MFAHVQAATVVMEWECPDCSQFGVHSFWLYYGTASHADVMAPSGDGASPYEQRHLVEPGTARQTTIEVPDGFYYFRITAVNDVGESDFSNEASGEVKATVPNAPTRLRFPGDAPVEAVPIQSATASSDDGNVAANTIDGDLATRWSASGDGEWITFDLGAVYEVHEVALAWYLGDTRQAVFDIVAMLDGNWTVILETRNSGTTVALETHSFDPVETRYVRIVGHGTNKNLWNSITEAQVFGRAR